MTPTDLAALVDVMREKGVTALKSDGLEIVLGAPPARPLARPDPDAPRSAPKKSSYDQLLFACTEGITPDDE